MARRAGIKEKIHLPIYDSIRVEPKKQLRDVETGSVWKFFVDATGKSKLETNQSLLSRFKRFEAQGMQVVISDLPAEFPDEIAGATRNAEAGNLITKLIYNTVTALVVGDTTVIEMPTCFVFGEAGPYLGTPRASHRGERSTIGTFRFSEPIIIDKQQNFRAQIEVPHAESLKELQRIYGPMFIWVVLDGDLTRDA